MASQRSPRWRNTVPVAGLTVLLAAALSAQPDHAAVGGTRQADGKALYSRLCVACHGPTGAGDGPAAAALNPRPASFSDSAFQAARTDEQLTTAIASGKAPMPGFGRQLTPAEIRALVTYLRALGRPAKTP